MTERASRVTELALLAMIRAGTQEPPNPTVISTTTFVLNPLKLLYGVASAIRETRHAAKVAGWNEAAISSLDPNDIMAITADDVALCSPLQIWELLKYHGGSESQLPSGIFDGVTELVLIDAGLSGKGPLSAISFLYRHL